MSNPLSSDSQVLKHIFEPLLEDFRYWFERSLSLLETEKLSFMTEIEQNSLINRVKEATQAVQVATMLYKITGEQAGVEVAAMMPWHNLLMECQAVGMRFRQSQAILDDNV